MATTSVSTPVIESDQQTISGRNRGPITNLWVLPASCTATLSYTSQNSDLLYFGHHGSVFDSKCYPTGANKALPSAGVDWASFYYSPAICPSGWITATTFSASFGVFPSPKYLSLGPETSAALCCPSGYSYYENGPQCYSPIAEEQLITYYSYLSDDNTWKKGTPTTTAWRVSTIIKGDGIPIFWQQSDSAVLARASVITMNPQATTVSTSSSTPVSPSVSPTTINTQTLSSNGLSTGAKIGLGVGIPLAIVVLLAIGLLLWRRQRKHKAVNTSDRVHDLVHQMDNKDALDAPAYVAQGQGAEIYGHEVQLQQPYYELQTSSDKHHSRHELPGVAHR